MFQGHVSFRGKLNMKAENDDFQKISPFPGADFQVPCSHWKLTCHQKNTVVVGRWNFLFEKALFRDMTCSFLFFFGRGGGYLLSTRPIGHPQQPKKKGLDFDNHGWCTSYITHVKPIQATIWSIKKTKTSRVPARGNNILGLHMNKPYVNESKVGMLCEGTSHCGCHRKLFNVVGYPLPNLSYVAGVMYPAWFHTQPRTTE